MYCRNCESEVVEDKGELICKCGNRNWWVENEDEEEIHYRDLEIKSKSLVNS